MFNMDYFKESQQLESQQFGTQRIEELYIIVVKYGVLNPQSVLIIIYVVVCTY